MRDFHIATEVRKALGLADPTAVRVRIMGDSIYCTITPKVGQAKVGRMYVLRVEPDIMQFYGPWTEESVIAYFVGEAEKAMRQASGT